MEGSDNNKIQKMVISIYLMLDGVLGFWGFGVLGYPGSGGGHKCVFVVN